MKIDLAPSARILSPYRRGLQAIARRSKIAYSPIFIVSPALTGAELRALLEAQPGQILPLNPAKVEVVQPVGPPLSFLRPACLSAWKYRLWDIARIPSHDDAFVGVLR